MKDKAKILTEIAEHLVGAAEGLKKLAEILPSEVEPPKTQQNESPKVTLEEVRSVLTSLSAAGKTSEVRNLIEKYGATKLSEVDPVFYKELMEDAKNVS